MRTAVLIIIAALAALLAAGCGATAVTAPAATTVATAVAPTPTPTTPAPTNAAGLPVIPAHTYTAAQDAQFLAELSGYGLEYPPGPHRDGILLIGHAMADLLNNPGTTLTPDELTSGMARGGQNQNPPLPKVVIGQIVASVVDAYTDR